MSQSRGGNSNIQNAIRALLGLMSALRERRNARSGKGRSSAGLPASQFYQNDLILRSVGEGIYRIGLDGVATFANPAAATLLGYGIDELLCRNLHELIHHTRRDGAHFPAVECPIYRALKEGIVTRVDDDAFWRKDGTLLPVEYISTPILEAGRIMGVVVCFRDISERLRLQSQVYEQMELVQQANQDMAAWQKELLRTNANYAESNHRLAEANAQLALQATTDGLTGLRNHRALHEQLAEHARGSFQSGRALSFLLLDVDRFKQYNDSFGHPAGDQVLRDIAAILEQTVALEGFCARYGGEEFAVALPDRDAAQARDMGEKIRAAVARAPWIQRPITVSVGAATCPAHSTDTSELIAEADLALYRSKQRGRDCVTHAGDEDERWAFCGVNSRPYTDILREMLLAQEATLTSASEHIKAVLVEGYDRTIAAWARLLDMKDKETEGHSARVTDMTVRLARWVGMNEEETLYARWGALLHDIGKMGVPDAILLKPDKLTDAEWDVMRRHPGIAYEMLVPITFLRAALDIPYAHHEKWDGSGYPQGLKGDDIPLPARLFAVIDVYDALRSDRPYRAGWPEAKVRQHLRDSCGTHFDPRAVNAFLEMLSAQDAPLRQDIPLAQAA